MRADARWVVAFGFEVIEGGAMADEAADLCRGDAKGLAIGGVGCPDGGVERRRGDGPDRSGEGYDWAEMGIPSACMV